MIIARTDPIRASQMPFVPHDDHIVPLPAAWECDLADNSLRWTPGVYDMFGFVPGTRVDRRATVEMYTEDSASLLHWLRSRAIARRGSFTFDAQIRRTDGAPRWIRVTADVVARDGYVTRLYGHKLDITGQVESGAIRV